MLAGGPFKQIRVGGGGGASSRGLSLMLYCPSSKWTIFFKHLKLPCYTNTTFDKGTMWTFTILSQCLRQLIRCHKINSRFGNTAVKKNSERNLCHRRGAVTIGMTTLGRMTHGMTTLRVNSKKCSAQPGI
jgi:hypothetical protein